MADRTPCGQKLGRALLRAQHTHVVWVVYSQLLFDAKDGVVDYTTEELGERIGVRRTTAHRALKVLRELGVVEGPHAVGAGWQTRVYRDGTPATHAMLAGIIAGTIVVDMKAGSVIAGEGDDEPELFEGVYSGTQSGASSMVFINTFNNKTSITSDENENAPTVPMVPAAEAPAKGAGRNGKRYVPLTDEYRPAIERIQAYANELFKTSHGLLNAAGHEIGKSTGISGRYGVIRRALVEWGFTEEQLKGALKMAAKDPWWAERRINDTVNLLRKLQHVQKWVDLWSSGQEHPKAGKWDKKQTDLGASKVMGENGKVDQSKVTAEFV